MVNMAFIVKDIYKHIGRENNMNTDGTYFL